MSVEAVRSKQPRNFDLVSFTVVPPRRFQDLRVGDIFRAPSRTLTDAHAAAFQTVSADNHPVHNAPATVHNQRGELVRAANLVQCRKVASTA
jgi:hypothetical protein